MKKLTKDIIPAVEKEYLSKYSLFGNKYIEVCKYFQRQGADLIQVIFDHPKIKLVKTLMDKLDSTGLIIGGNISHKKEIKGILTAGAEFVVIGRYFVLHPERIKGYLEYFGKHLIFSVDDSRGYITANKNIKTLDYVNILVQNKAKNMVYVSDATKLKGEINLRLFKQIRKITKNSSLIYSGGVQTINDIINLKNAGADSIIAGTALYENSLNYKEAVKVFRS